jgi:hypothetical protein
MTNNKDDPASQTDAFRQQTPGVYKWAMGAGGLVAAATTTSLTFKPDAAGYALSGLILFILLIFIVISLEMGTAKFDVSNPIAKNAQMQVTALSWFATVALVLGATSIMTSILFRWPLDMSLSEDTTTRSYLTSIKQYDLPSSFIERSSHGWEEKSQRDQSVLYSFTEDLFNPEFLRLSDNKRSVKIRIPTRGGMLQWSLNEKFNDCDTRHCWGDVAQAKMRR